MKTIGKILVALGIPSAFCGAIFHNGDVWHDFLFSMGFLMLAMILMYAGICFIDHAVRADQLREMNSQARRERMAQREEALQNELARQKSAREMMDLLNSVENGQTGEN